MEKLTSDSSSTAIVLRSTIPVNSVKIVWLDVEISGLTEIVKSIFKQQHFL